MRRLEILHVLGTAQWEGTSIARIVGMLAGELDPARFRIRAWFLGEDGPLVQELREAGVEARAFGWTSGARDPLGALRFYQALRGRTVDLVHQHQGARSVRWMVKRALGMPILVHLHGAINDQRVASAGADAVIAGSRWIASQIAGFECDVVYPGVRIPSGGGGDKVEPAVVGMATRLVAGKGLLEMLAAMQSFDPGVRLEIAGEGPLRGVLEQEIRARELESRVALLGWQRELQPLFGKWSVFVMPSVDEGFGMAALEAMAAGVPVVGVRSGALPELIEDGATGLLGAAGDAGELGKNVGALLKSAELRGRFGKAAQRRAAELFSPSRMAGSTAAIYERLVSSTERRGSGLASKRRAATP